MEPPQAHARPSNRAPSDTARHPFEDCQQQMIAAADDTSGLIVSVVHLLTNRPNSYGDLKLCLMLLNRSMIMSRLALQIFEYTPLAPNLVRTIKPAILDCRVVLQELLDKLEASREGSSTTGIRHLWGRVLWGGFDNQELCLIKGRLGMHQAALMEFLAALNSYVPYPYKQIIDLS